MNYGAKLTSSNPEFTLDLGITGVHSGCDIFTIKCFSNHLVQNNQTLMINLLYYSQSNIYVLQLSLMHEVSFVAKKKLYYSVPFPYHTQQRLSKGQQREIPSPLPIYIDLLLIIRFLSSIIFKETFNTV